MTTKKPKEIVGVLYFGEHEPRIIGHLKIGKTHYSIAGIRRSDVKADITATRQPEDHQRDLFEGRGNETQSD